MARKRFEEEGETENHERWLVSYADFMTLLFAFFVVMYAVSSVNEGKYKVVSNSLVNAFGKPGKIEIDREPIFFPRPQLLQLPRPRSNDTLLRKEREQMTGIARDILKVLAPLVSQGKVRVTETNRGVSIEISDSILFAPADAGIGVESSEVLKAIALVLVNDNHSIQVEGHTDNVPISKPQFPSNWELSAVRASSVVRLFIEGGIAENRLVAVGHGSNQPVASNATPEGRMRNRRVQVMILSGMPEVVTEVPVAKGKSASARILPANSQ
jgi:chemotaxis protein MotB